MRKLIEREFSRVFPSDLSAWEGTSLTAKEWARFCVFERGELAVRAGLDLGECPYSKPEIRELWIRGFLYGDKETNDVGS